eukprot:7019152-Pyramimonas_sp.AAC.1
MNTAGRGGVGPYHLGLKHPLGVDVRGYGVDVRGYGVDVRGYGVDVRGYGVERLRGCCTFLSSLLVSWG